MGNEIPLMKLSKLDPKKTLLSIADRDDMRWDFG